MSVVELDLRKNFAPAFFAVAIFAPTLWMAMDRDLPYERVSGTIVPAAPVPGDFISVQWDIRVRRLCPPSEPRNVTRQIVTSTGHIIDYAPVEGTFGTGNGVEKMPTTELVRTFQLPRDLQPGPATYYSKACFACNPLQRFWPVCVDKPKLTFEISGP